jgi:Zn finger protein HypA/HybF involved in hydrogenase expression
MSYYEGDAWTYHEPVWTECGECEQEFDQQEEGEGNICPTCKDKEEGESK